jgi:TPR repeat protein
MYYNGTGVTQNTSEAILWYKKAAKQNNSDAQKRLKELNESW